MKFFRSKQDAQFNQAISELRREQPDAKTLSASSERVWQRLQSIEGADAATSALQLIRGCAISVLCSQLFISKSFLRLALSSCKITCGNVSPAVLSLLAAVLKARRTPAGGWSRRPAVFNGVLPDSP